MRARAALVRGSTMFVTFEGPEGSGKSTALAAVAQALQDAGRTPLCTREPGGSELGKRLRSMLLESGAHMSPQAELCLFLADRAQHVADVIRPALAQGRIVLCDRFADSTIVYQGIARGLGVDRIRDACTLAADGLVPDLTILLDVPAREGVARALARNKQTNKAGSPAEDRFDTETLAFHESVRAGFLALAKAEPSRIVVIDGTQDKAVVAAACLKYLEERQRLSNAGSPM